MHLRTHTGWELNHYIISLNILKTKFLSYVYFRCYSEKPYHCENCGKTFARGGQLSQHMVTHTGIKKHKCEYCGSKFSCLANLKIHLKVRYIIHIGTRLNVNLFYSFFFYILQKSHLDERDFVCHICSKAFYRRDALKKHILCYHENVKAFHCTICNKQFKGHLPQHMRTHQSIKTHVST